MTVLNVIGRTRSTYSSFKYAIKRWILVYSEFIQLKQRDILNNFSNFSAKQPQLAFCQQVTLSYSSCLAPIKFVHLSIIAHTQQPSTAAHASEYLLSAKSVLFPTSMIITSLPLSVLTSSIHFEVCWNEFRSVDKKKTNATRINALLTRDLENTPTNLVCLRKDVHR